MTDSKTGSAGFVQPWAFGIGLTTANSTGKTLEVYYALLYKDTCRELAEHLAKTVSHTSGNGTYPLTPEALKKAQPVLAGCKEAGRDKAILTMLAGTDRHVVVTFLAQDTKPATVEEAYLKLTLVSHHLVKPRELNLSGLMDLLPTVAWTSQGAIDIDELPEHQLKARLSGTVLTIFSVDKFPSMVSHTVPKDVRIADGMRVRLGAYVGPGTAVMAEGFINYNAGTAGPNRIDGRIQGGVFVGSGSDLGGASSIMGSVYGDEERVVAIGKDCLIGANGGAGISLGDGCIVEAGLYVTAGTKVELLDKTGKKVGTVKARDLTGKPNLLFRRNSSTGQVEAMPSYPAAQRN